MNSTVTRSLSGIIFIGAMLAGLLFSPWLFALLFVIMTGMMLWEFYRITMGTEFLHTRLLAIAAGCMALSLAVAVFAHSSVLIEYMSPTVLVSSVCLVILFSRLKIRSGLLRRVTPLVFSAYLLQDNQLVRELLIKDRFASHASPLIVVAAGLACLVIGCAVDIPREWLFQKLHVRSRLDWVDRLLQTNGAISGKDDKL